MSVVEVTARTDIAALTRHAAGHATGLVEVLPDEATPFFRMELLARGVDVPAGFAVAVVVSGAGALGGTRGDPVGVERGQTVVVPAAAGNWHVDGDVRLLVCRPGTSWPLRSTPGTNEEGAR